MNPSHGGLSNAEIAEGKLIVMNAVRAAHQLGGALLQIFDDGTIATFCSHCDHRDDPERCPRKDQGYYVFRDWCGWSHRNGIKLDHVTFVEIRFQNNNYNRDQISELDRAIANRK